MTDYDQSFLATWGIYPKRNGKKRGKKPASDQWVKLSLEEQRAAYLDIKARNMAGGWEFIRDMERYLKNREWEDEWTGQRLNSDPDLVDIINDITPEQLCDQALTHRLCEHQLRSNWTYYGPKEGGFTGVIVPQCEPCGRKPHKVTSADIPAT